MENPNTVQNKSYKITNSDRKTFNIIFSISDNKLEILINEKSGISKSYKTSLDIKNFQEINKFFRQFDTINEIFEFISNLEKPEENIKITNDNKFVNLDISLPSFSKFKENNIKIKIPQIELKENDLIVKLCEEVKKIDILESKINFLFHFTGKTEKDFLLYIDLMNNIGKSIEKSSIIEPSDFYEVSIGIKEKLNKKIKDVKLLYRASRDGDGNEFHIKCDGIKNTVTFVKSINKRRFGGFANKEWNSNDIYISDPNAFLFSLDNHECYYFNLDYNMNQGFNRNMGKMFNSSNNRNMNSIFCSYNNGPIWGNNNSYDLLISFGCLSNNNSRTNQYSYNYKGRIQALSGENNFQIEDYETYELILD